MSVCASLVRVMCVRFPSKFDFCCNSHVGPLYLIAFMYIYLVLLIRF